MNWEIVTGDCRAELPRVRSGSVRLVFADPPYNQNVRYGSHFDDNMSDAGYLSWSESWLGETPRLLRADGSLWLLVNHRYGDKLRGLAEGAGLHWWGTITWYESFGKNRTDQFNPCSRPIYVLRKDPKHFRFNAMAPEIRRPSDRLAKYNDKR